MPPHTHPPPPQVRHGAVVFVAELLPALAAADKAGAAAAAEAATPYEPLLSAARQAEVAGLVPAIDKARLYRGKGGEVMREAVGRLVECASAISLHMTPQQHAKVCVWVEGWGGGCMRWGEGAGGLWCTASRGTGISHGSSCRVAGQRPALPHCSCLAMCLPVL
jgi:hypothetical protein